VAYARREIHFWHFVPHFHGKSDIQNWQAVDRSRSELQLNRRSPQHFVDRSASGGKNKNTQAK
jgi:hypothetical protein